MQSGKLNQQQLFQPTRPLRGATLKPPRSSCPTAAYFNPRAPCGARPPSFQSLIALRLISTHAPLAGRDRSNSRGILGNHYFNPRAPCGARLWVLEGDLMKIPISTHAPLAGRDKPQQAHEQIKEISTHAPLAGRDRGVFLLLHAVIISTHAPLAGRDRLCRRPILCRPHFNPRAPCGARP